MPIVSIIITNFNGKKYLKNCFDSLKENTFSDFELILIDNASSDESVDFVSENYPEVKIVRLDKNLGLSIASNKAREQASGKYLFFYNNDTIADRAMLAELVGTMEVDSHVGICGCKIMTYDGKKVINSGVPVDIFGYPFGGGQPFYVDAAIFIRSELFDKMGGFDERMFLYGEDRDLCWRCWLYGYKVKVVDRALFFHDSACIDMNLKKYKTNIFKRYSSEFNSLRSVLKNYSFWSLIFILPCMICINFCEVLLFSLRGNFKFIAKTYIQAYIDNIKFLKSTVLLRKKIQKERKINDYKIMRYMQWMPGKLLLFKRMGGVPRFE